MPNELMNRDLVTCARFPALVTAFTLTSHWLLVTFPFDLIGRGDLFCFVSMTHLSFFFSYFYFRLSICSRTIHRLIRQAGKIQSTIKILYSWMAKENLHCCSFLQIFSPCFSLNRVEEIMEILAVFFPVNKYHNKSCIQLMLSAKNVVLDFSRKDQA